MIPETMAATQEMRRETILTIQEDLLNEGELSTTRGIRERFKIGPGMANLLLDVARGRILRDRLERVIEEAQTGILTDGQGNLIPPIGKLNWE